MNDKLGAGQWNFQLTTLHHWLIVGGTPSTIAVISDSFLWSKGKDSYASILNTVYSTLRSHVESEFRIYEEQWPITLWKKSGAVTMLGGFGYNHGPLLSIHWKKKKNSPYLHGLPVMS
jgi:hypothetical protein